MLFLVLAVFCSVTVSVLLKMAKRQSVRLEQAIAINYLTATGLSLLLLSPQFPDQISSLPWALFLALGILLPSVFMVMGRAVEHAGIVKSDAAQRLSLILPIIAAATVFGETVTQHRLIGIGLAFVALFCLLIRPETGQLKNSRQVTATLSLIGVWFGYGVIDILFKQLSKYGSTVPVSLVISFTTAAALMFIYLFLKGHKWNIKNIIGGLTLGLFNFGNILFYIKAHQNFSSSPTLVFAGMNIGVIALGTVVGAVFFKEKLRPINVVGLGFAIIAIITLF